MANTKFYGTGRRKSSIARVYLVPGTGKITVNKRDMDEYFGLETLKIIARQPLEATNTADKYRCKSYRSWWWIYRTGRRYPSWYRKSTFRQ